MTCRGNVSATLPGSGLSAVGPVKTPRKAGLRSEDGCGGRTRTADIRVMSPALYQLSYTTSLMVAGADLGIGFRVSLVFGRSPSIQHRAHQPAHPPSHQRAGLPSPRPMRCSRPGAPGSSGLVQWGRGRNLARSSHATRWCDGAGCRPATPATGIQSRSCTDDGFPLRGRSLGGFQLARAAWPFWKGIHSA